MAAQTKLSKLVDEIKELSVLELSKLVKTLQEELGVTAMPSMASGAAPAAGTETAEGAAPAGAGIQTVVLTNPGANKIAVIKALREINPNLGLKEAKDLTEAAPKAVLADVKAEDAKAAVEKLQGAGATVELK